MYVRFYRLVYLRSKFDYEATIWPLTALVFYERMHGLTFNNQVVPALCVNWGLIPKDNTKSRALGAVRVALKGKINVGSSWAAKTELVMKCRNFYTSREFVTCSRACFEIKAASRWHLQLPGGQCDKLVHQHSLTSCFIVALFAITSTVPCLCCRTSVFNHLCLSCISMSSAFAMKGIRSWL